MLEGDREYLRRSLHEAMSEHPGWRKVFFEPMHDDDDEHSLLLNTMARSEPRLL